MHFTSAETNLGKFVYTGKVSYLYYLFVFPRLEHVQPNYFKPCNGVLVPTFILLVIQFYSISIFKMKNSVFTPKAYISSCSQHVQPNYFKLCNSVFVPTLYTSVDTILPCFNIWGEKQCFHTQNLYLFLFTTC